MFRRSSAVAAVLFAALAPWAVGSAAAQERADFAQFDLTRTVLNNSSVPVMRLPDFEQLSIPIERPAVPKPGGSSLLNSLYASTAVMQGLDVHSTLQAFRAGAKEGNPLMSGITSHRGAFIAAKAAVAVSTILASRHMAKRNKVAAVVTMVAVNSAYAMVIRHNYRLARGR